MSGAVFIPTVCSDSSSHADLSSDVKGVFRSLAAKARRSRC
jgi:hypothetical protein